jgi:hypothetical protein
VLSLVVDNGVAKLPDQIHSSSFCHFRFQAIDDPNIFWLCLVISSRGFRYEFGDPLHSVAQNLCFLFILISTPRVAAGFGPFGHTASAHSSYISQAPLTMPAICSDRRNELAPVPKWTAIIKDCAHEAEETDSIDDRFVGAP